MLRKLVLLVIAPLAIIAGAAAPAFASSNPVTVTVNTQIVMTGLQNVVFNGLPGTKITGCPVTAPSCQTAGQPGFGNPTESFTVQSNSATGYTLSEQAATSFFLTSGGANSPIADTMWTIDNAPPAGGAHMVFNPSAAATTVYKSQAAPTTDAFTESWTLDLTTLSNLAAGSYTNTLTYLAVAS